MSTNSEYVKKLEEENKMLKEAIQDQQHDYELLLGDFRTLESRIGNLKSRLNRSIKAFAVWLVLASILLLFSSLR